jgi:hypothetical protein
VHRTPKTSTKISQRKDKEMKYMVYWKDMLKNKQGDAPMGSFDTTIEANAYVKGFVDAICIHTNDKPDSLRKEFVVERVDKNAKQK